MCPLGVTAISERINNNYRHPIWTPYIDTLYRQPMNAPRAIYVFDGVMTVFSHCLLPHAPPGSFQANELFEVISQRQARWAFKFRFRVRVYACVHLVELKVAHHQSVVPAGRIWD